MGSTRDLVTTSDQLLLAIEKIGGRRLNNVPSRRKGQAPLPRLLVTIVACPGITQETVDLSGITTRITNAIGSWQGLPGRQLPTSTMPPSADCGESGSRSTTSRSRQLQRSKQLQRAFKRVFQISQTQSK